MYFSKTIVNVNDNACNVQLPTISLAVALFFSDLQVPFDPCNVLQLHAKIRLIQWI